MPWNPFGREAAAYRFLNASVGYFAAIAVASVLGGHRAGVTVFIALTAIGLTWLLLWRDRAPRPLPQAPRRLRGPDERRVLVIATGTASRKTRLPVPTRRPWPTPTRYVEQQNRQRLRPRSPSTART